MCSVFKLFLLKSSLLLAKRLARKTRQRKPNCGEGIVSIKPRPKSVSLSWFIVFFYCFNFCMICLYCPPALRDIFRTSMARYGLFVLKVSLNTPNKQTNKQTNKHRRYKILMGAPQRDVKYTEVRKFCNNYRRLSRKRFYIGT